MEKLYKLIFPAGILLLWWGICRLELVPSFLLPTPLDTLEALWENLGIILGHTRISLTESFAGLGAAIGFSLVCSVLMDRFLLLRKVIFPGLILSQTIPVVAIAPLLVLWLGYGMLPKIVLIFLVCFFPVAVSLLSGLAASDEEQIRLFRSMGAGYFTILKEVKLPQALPSLFSGLKIAVSYSIVGAVIAEWLGGDGGLGVYMTLARKNFAYDEMFAVILVVCVISLILIKVVELIQYLMMPYKRRRFQ